MSESHLSIEHAASPSNRNVEHSRESSASHSLKIAATVVGILVALSGAVVGIYQGIASFKNFQLQIASEEKETATAKLQAAAEETRRLESQNRSTEEMRKKDIELKQTELQTEQERRKALELGITRDRQAQELTEKFKINGEARARQRDDEEQLSVYLQDIFAKDQPAPQLASLTRYAKPKGENLSNMLTALVARLDQANTPTEINIIFQLFNKSGAEAIDAVTDANRNAFEKYKRDISSLARAIYNDERKRLEESPQMAPKENLSYIVRRKVMDSLRIRIGLFELVDRIISDATMRVSTSEIPLGAVDSSELILKRLASEAEILVQSKRSLERLLRLGVGSVDLSATDISEMKFPPGQINYSINLRNAWVSGADFSSANILTGIDSLLEADFGYLAIRRDPLEKILESRVRLSERQRSELLHSHKN